MPCLYSLPSMVSTEFWSCFCSGDATTHPTSASFSKRKAARITEVCYSINLSYRQKPLL